MRDEFDSARFGPREAAWWLKRSEGRAPVRGLVTAVRVRAHPFEEVLRPLRAFFAFGLVARVPYLALKLGTGLISGSLALVSAGIESSGDVVAALLTLLAIRVAVRPADREHNYGHRRAENIAALGEAAIVFVGGLVIAFEGRQTAA